MRCAVDTGGTFTDLVVEGDGRLAHLQGPTTPDDPVEGILDVLGARPRDARHRPRASCSARGRDASSTARRARSTRSSPAHTARTALPRRREGHPRHPAVPRGRPHRALRLHAPATPTPYVPRALTFEVPERIGAEGEVVRPLDEAGAVARDRAAAPRTRSRRSRVCLLWSIVNPAHELRVGELLERAPARASRSRSRTSSTRSLREYRRASSTAIDASLKPLMTRLPARASRAALREAGFGGRLLMVTSQRRRARRRATSPPRRSTRSTPARRWRRSPAATTRRPTAAPRPRSSPTPAARATTSALVRDGRIPWTRETWLGRAVRSAT